MNLRTVATYGGGLDIAPAEEADVPVEALAEEIFEIIDISIDGICGVY